MRSGADIEGVYRYRLWREWEPTKPGLAFVMLNPSTADAEQDDATIRRCLAFARSWGFGRLDVANLYAFRATKPSELWKTPDPIGPRNAAALRETVDAAALVVAAWGANAPVERHIDVARALLERSPLHALGFTKAGLPRHPLYVSSSVRAERWQPVWPA